MQILLLLAAKVLPLYVIILLGFVAGKFLHVKKESVSSLLLYIIAPMVVFNSVMTTKIDIGSLSLPLLFFCLCSLISILFYFIAGRVWADRHKNILAFTAGNGNTGYFGLPLAITLLGDQITGLLMLCVLGVILYENSVGFFMTAHGHFSIKITLQKILKLPTLYAFAFGAVLSLLQIQLTALSPVLENFKGAYTVLGMMIIGLGLSDIKQFGFDFKFTFIAFLAKFIVWPLLILLIIFCDKNWFHFWTPLIYQVMIILSIVPMAANTVTYATELKIEPEKAALTVLLSTLVALIYIPVMVTLLL